MRRRVGQVLGDEIAATDRQDLVNGINELEDVLRGSQADHNAMFQTTAELAERRSDLQSDWKPLAD